MPYLNMQISAMKSPEVVEKIASILMRHTTTILGKNPEVSSCAIQFVPADNWFVGGSRVSDLKAETFYLDIKVTEGTNTKLEKAEFVEHVFADMQAILGPITPASYIVIHDVRGDSWGFQGKTQEYRFIKAQSL